MDPLLLLLIGMLVVVGGILYLRLPAFLALILGALITGILTTDSGLALFAASKKMSPEATQALQDQGLGTRLAAAFGSTCGKIGILIAMASVIGSALLKSGSAEKIIRSTIRFMGVKRVPVAFLASGFTLAIPVFFDTVFYLMIPLARSMALRNISRYSLYVLAIIAGAVMAHSLVPPTPGPLFVAGELGVNIGMMMLGGLVVGAFAAAAGYAYAVWANRKWPIPLRDTAENPQEELLELSEKQDTELPSFFVALLPILLPIVLIAGNTIVKASGWNLPEALLTTMDTLGNSNIALTISAAVALFVMVNYMRDREQVWAAIQEALKSAGMIILITGAGGAFGGMLQQSGVGPRIQELAVTYQVAILPLAFGVTALIRMAQGSATVAMITAIGILSSLGDASTLGFHPLYLALAVGCGSKPFPWMNDSGFWIICKMSGFTEGEMIKNFTVMMTIMGVAGLIITMIGAAIFPLV